MKISGKILSLLICMLLLTQAAFAASVGGVEFTSAPDGWTVNNATVEDGIMTLAFDTTDKAARGKSEITTSKYDFSSGILRISFDSVATVETNGDKIKKTITLEDGNMWNSTELINIKSGVISFFGSAASVETTEASVTVAVDIAASPVQASAWVDGELVYSGDFTAWKAALNTSAVAIALKNNATSSVADTTEWVVSNFNADIYAGSYGFSSLPADGQAMISPADYEGIALTYGTVMSDAAYDKANYSLIADGEPAEFELVDKGTAVTIVPVGGLRDLTRYELTIATITDIFGDVKATDKTIAFTTAYEGYTAPVVTSEFDFSADYYIGQPLDIPFNVDGDCVQLDIYADGTLVSTLTSAPYIYSINESEAKAIELQAVATDSAGGLGYSEVYTVTILNHEAPVITVSGIEEGSACDVNNLPEITVTAEDDNGIESIEFYSDSKLRATYTESPATVSLAGLSGGGHTLKFIAKDIYGKETSVEYNISIESVHLIETYTNDFADYKGNNTLPTGCQGGPQRGYLAAGVIDEDHGNSLIVGMETANEEHNTDNTAFVGFPGGGATGGVNIEFDMYINERPADVEKNRYRMSFRTANNETTFFFITANEMQFCKTNQNVDLKVPYEIKTWYHVTINVNTSTLDYDMIISDGADFNQNYSGRLNSNSGGLNYFRFFGPAFDDVPTFAAIDNMVIRQKLELPELVFEGDVAPSATSFSFTLSTTLKASDLSTDTVKISDSYGEVAIASVVSTDGAVVTVTPAVPLRSNMDYTVSISPDVCYSVGAPLGVECIGEFKTACAPLDVTEGWFVGNSFNFTANNTTGEEATVTVVTQTWKDGKVTGVKVIPVTVADGSGETYMVNTPSIPNGGYATAYIWDGVVAPKAITHRIYISK